VYYIWEVVVVERTREFGRSMFFYGALTPEIEHALRADAERCIAAWSLQPVEVTIVGPWSTSEDADGLVGASWVATCAA
jgi:hypothetical protein